MEHLVDMDDAVRVHEAAARKYLRMEAAVLVVFLAAMAFTASYTHDHEAFMRVTLLTWAALIPGTVWFARKFARVENAHLIRSDLVTIALLRFLYQAVLASWAWAVASAVHLRF